MSILHRTLPATENPINQARSAGYKLGRSDRHSTLENYQTTEEWQFWLAGWRAGYADYIATRRAEYAKKGIQVSPDFIKMERSA
jgi:ribosome modulation factor